MKLEQVSLELTVDGADARTPIKGSYGLEVFPRTIVVNATAKGLWGIEVRGKKIKKDGTPSQVGAGTSFATWDDSRTTWPQFVKDAADMAIRMGGWSE